MIKTKLSDYKTQVISIYVEDKEHKLEIRSMASREYKDALAEHFELMKYAKENDIAPTKKVKLDDWVLGEDAEKEVISDFNLKAASKLVSSLVAEWPFEEDVKQALFDNEDFAELVYTTGKQLQDEFLSKKKT